jgi:hypothetical protein
VTQREYVTARSAAERLGVPEPVVIDDVQEGMDGQLPALIGGRFGDAWIVYAWQLDGDHLERHRERLSRLATADSATEVKETNT